MFGHRAERTRLQEENERLRAELAQTSRERDVARLNAFQAVPDDDLDFLFIVTYGRSGSTLLMGLLNSLPGFHLRGENAGIVYDLFQYQSKAVQAKEVQAAGEELKPQHPWYGIDQYPADLAAARMRRLVIDTLLRPPAGTKVTGFKEIRWWMPKPVEYLDFIDSMFPGARYILNTRNLDDVAQSSWYRKKPEARESLETMEQRLKETVASRGDRGHHIHYDDYVKDPSAVEKMCDWLGVPFDPETIAQVLATKHSTSRHWAQNAS